MRLRELRDVYAGQDIYIVGSGPTNNLFPHGLLRNRICLSLNDAYKIHPAITPIALMHHQHYAHTGPDVGTPYHENFFRIRYPIVKATGRMRLEEIDFDHPYFYYFDWSHDLELLRRADRATDVLYYMSEGCALHAALQVCWIMGAARIFTIGCDSSTLGGRHYADYEKGGIRDNEQLARGAVRNYDAYVLGTLFIQDFLKSQGISVLNLSPLVGYGTAVDQYARLLLDEGHANADPAPGGGR